MDNEEWSGLSECCGRDQGGSSLKECVVRSSHPTDAEGLSFQFLVSLIWPSNLFRLFVMNHLRCIMRS